MYKQSRCLGDNKDMQDFSDQTSTLLTPRQKLFCDWYVKLGNATEAAIKAGYSEKTARSIACENLTKPDIQTYLAHRRTELEELLGFNKATVIQDLLAIKGKCMVAKPVMEYDRNKRAVVQVTEEAEDGQEVGVFEFDSLGAVRAIETINKMMDYYTPTKTEDVTPVSHKEPATIVINKTYADQEPNQLTA